MVKSTSSVSSEYDGLIRSLSNQHHNHHPNGIGGDGNENEANDKTANDSNVPAVNMDDFDVSNMESFLSMMEEQQMKLKAKKRKVSKMQDMEVAAQSGAGKLESIEKELEDIESLVKRMNAASSCSLSSKPHSSKKADCGNYDIVAAASAAGNTNNNSSDDLKAVMNLMLRLWGPVNQKLVAMNQELKEMKQNNNNEAMSVNDRLSDLADRFEKFEGAVTNIQSEQEKARESMQENQSKVEKIIEIKEEELKQNLVEKEIQVMKNELKNKLRIERYFSKFELLIDSWTNVLLNKKEGETVNLQPLFFHYPSNDFADADYDIRDACEMFANVLKKLEIKASNKFVFKDTENKKEIEEALNEAENGILLLEDWFFNFRSVENGVDYFETVLDEAKQKNIFLVTTEHSDLFDQSMQSISNLESWISNHFQRTDL